MRIVAINGGPRKKCNTAQLLDSFIKGVNDANPEVKVITYNLYDYLYTGCKSCFACQLTANRADLGCRIKDNISDILSETFHADGIVFGSPIYYLNVTAQLRAFWERLMYPGRSSKVIPTALIYTMNMNEEQEAHFAKAPMDIINMYIKDCFGTEPETLHAYDTFQYNENTALNEQFRSRLEEKKAKREKQFPIDLENAYNMGKNMVDRILIMDKPDD